jgi:hypothetical protein
MATAEIDKFGQVQFLLIYVPHWIKISFSTI